MLHVHVSWMATSAHVRPVFVNGNPFDGAAPQQPYATDFREGYTGDDDGGLDLDSQILVNPDSSSSFR
jgi:hypothetical protein